MDILQLIDNLEDVIEDASSVPLTSKCLIDKEEIFERIQEIRLQLPEDLKQAKWVKEERQRILMEAQKEADNILKGAEDKIAALVNEHEITKHAQEQAEIIIANAQNNAKDIRLGTLEYADGMLVDMENVIEDVKSAVFKSMSEVSNQVSQIDGIINIIKENRETLRK